MPLVLESKVVMNLSFTGLRIFGFFDLPEASDESFGLYSLPASGSDERLLIFLKLVLSVTYCFVSDVYCPLAM